MAKIIPLVGWVQLPGAAAAATPAIDISNLPAGLGGEPAFVDAFVLRFTVIDTGAGGAAAVSHRMLGTLIPQVQLRSAVYGDLFGTGITGSDLWSWIAPYMGWGGDSCRGHIPSPCGFVAAGGALTRNFDLILPFKNFRLAEPSDTSLPTVGFRGDTIQCTLGAAGVFGANHNIAANVTCTPYAILSTKKERRVPSVAHWGMDTSANAIMTTPGRPFGFVGLCSNLGGLGGPAAVNGYTAITVSRNDVFSGIGMTPEIAMEAFMHSHNGIVQSGILLDTVAGGGGVAGSLDWPYLNTAAFNLLGNALDATTLVLPVLWEDFGQKLSQISTSPESLKIETAGIAGVHRILYRAYAVQTAEFAGRMSGLYGLRNPVVRPKLLKPPRNASRGVKPQKLALVPYSLGE